MLASVGFILGRFRRELQTHMYITSSAFDFALADVKAVVQVPTLCFGQAFR